MKIVDSEEGWANIITEDMEEVDFIMEGLHLYKIKLSENPEKNKDKINKLSNMLCTF